MKDRSIICVQCEKSFVLSAGEQERLVARGFSFPKRCPECRRNRQRWTDTNDDWQNPGRGKKKRRRERQDPDAE